MDNKKMDNKWTPYDFTEKLFVVAKHSTTYPCLRLFAMQTTMLQKFCGWFFLQVRNPYLFLAEFIVLHSDIISNYNNFMSEK